MNIESFEEFLQKKHAEDYMGTDDNMSDSFDNFVTDMTVEEWIAMGDEYRDYIELKNYENTRRK